MIKPDKSILVNLIEKKDLNQFQYSHYLYSGIKQYLNEKFRKQIESEITQIYDEEIEIFEEKCRIGENDLYICSLIRQDSVEEFISFVNRTNCSLSKRIEPSIFDTNSFLCNKSPTLIEYATFFGSIQIIQYLIIMELNL